MLSFTALVAFPFVVAASKLAFLPQIVRVLFLFTRSDLKTLLLPVTVFAYLSVPETSVTRLLSAAAWTWLHLLQFCISNQIIDPAEDAANKPWRPVPAGLIDTATARRLRWALLPLCLMSSVAASVPVLGLALSGGFIANNELGLDSYWLVRSAWHALGYAFFNIGAATIACASPNPSENSFPTLAFVVNALIIFTTIHAADLRDVVGDKEAGRRTFPIVYPEASRITLSLCIVAWSVLLIVFCGPPVWFSVPFSAFALAVATRFYFCRTVTQDQASYTLYNAWLSIVQIIHLPCIIHLFR